MKWVARPGIPVLVLLGYKCICIFRLVEEASEVTAHHCFGGKKKRQSINEARKWWSTLLVSIYLPTLSNLEKEDQLLKFPVGSIIAIHIRHICPVLAREYNKCSLLFVWVLKCHCSVGSDRKAETAACGMANALLILLWRFTAGQWALTLDSLTEVGFNHFSNTCYTEEAHVLTKTNS